MRFVFALLVLSPFAARAHQQAVSYAELRVEGEHLRGTLRFSSQELRAFVPVDPERPDPAPLTALVVRPLVVRAQGKPCELEPGTRARKDGDDGVALEVAFRCPEPIELLHVRVGFLETLATGHTHLAKVEFPDGFVAQRVAQLDDPSYEVRERRSVLRDGARFLWLGVEHIFTGYDHVAFLVALLLLGGTLRELVKIVTAFTVAHSITLALAALSVITPSPRVVEPLIAASIVFVGVENVIALRHHAEARALGHRWLLTFGFGLVHGFGFASVLHALHLPRAALATGLVSFNLGVEVGQVFIVALALPLLRRLAVGPRGARALSVVVAALGLVWLAQRLAP